MRVYFDDGIYVIVIVRYRGLMSLDVSGLLVNGRFRLVRRLSLARKRRDRLGRFFGRFFVSFLVVGIRIWR